MSHPHEHGEHAHDHVHGPAWEGGWRYFVAAALLSVFAGLEVYLGLQILHSPLVVADAGHNLSDVIFALATGIVALIARAGKSNHFVATHLPLYASITVSVATVVVIAAAVLREAFEELPTSATDVALTAALGLASYGVNMALAAFLQRGRNALARATAQHFRSDAKVSLVLVPTALAAGVLSLTGVAWLPRVAMLVGTVYVVYRTAQDNLAQARTFAAELVDCRATDKLNRTLEGS